MAVQVKFRPDQPLFKAEALRFPLWLHLPAEVIRWTWQYHTANLHRDNPHKNALLNATLTQPAKRPHRLSYWTGHEVVQAPKWRRIVIRNFISWGVVASLVDSGVRSVVWPWVWSWLSTLLVWVGLTLVPWLYAHWLWLPVLVGGTLAGIMLVFKGLRAVFRRYNRWVWLGGWQNVWTVCKPVALEIRDNMKRAIGRDE